MEGKLKKSFAALLMLILGLPLFAQNINWSLVMLDSKKSDSMPFSRQVNLNTGDIISFLFSADADCHLYIITQNQERNAALLYNGFVTAGKDLQTGPIQIMPPGGMETVYFIVSGKADQKLEEMIAEYRKINNFRTGRNIINAAMDFRRNISALNEAPERPVIMGGAFRGFNQDLEGVAYSGADKYFKTIIINH
jgi:hypothetical protein